MADQIVATAAYFDADRLFAVDVGGDALTDGHDPGLRSPLADQLALAACMASQLPTTLIIAAPGIDGELTEATLRQRLRQYHGRAVGELVTADLAPAERIYDWHPSEASGLLAAAVKGLRGTVEIRDAGDQIQLSDSSVTINAVELEQAIVALPAAELVTTDSLNAAGDCIEFVTGMSELSYESAKAARRTNQAIHSPTSEDLIRIDAFAAEAHSRGADFISMRRLSELVGATNLSAYSALTELLRSSRPRHYAPGVYSVKARVS